MQVRRERDGVEVGALRPHDAVPAALQLQHGHAERTAQRRAEPAAVHPWRGPHGPAQRFRGRVRGERDAHDRLVQVDHVVGQRGGRAQREGALHEVALRQSPLRQGRDLQVRELAHGRGRECVPAAQPHPGGMRAGQHRDRRRRAGVEGRHRPRERAARAVPDHHRALATEGADDTGDVRRPRGHPVARRRFVRPAHTAHVHRRDAVAGVGKGGNLRAPRPPELGIAVQEEDQRRRAALGPGDRHVET